MNLVEEVDKNENIIDSYLEVISTKYKQKSILTDTLTNNKILFTVFIYLIPETGILSPIILM